MGELANHRFRILSILLNQLRVEAPGSGVADYHPEKGFAVTGSLQNTINIANDLVACSVIGRVHCNIRTKLSFNKQKMASRADHDVRSLTLLRLALDRNSARRY